MGLTRARSLTTTEQTSLSPFPVGCRVATALEGCIMPASFWFGISTVLLMAGLHPFVTYPLSLWLMERGRRRAGEPHAATVRPAPSFAICVCAYNEEATIERKVRNMLAVRERIGSL
jgi:hypothetical protein